MNDKENDEDEETCIFETRGGDGGVAISKSTAAALSTPCAVPMAFSASESGASISGTSMRISSAL